MMTFDEVEWKLVADLIRDRFGLVFGGTRRDILESRLRPRLTDLHLRSFTEYYHYLRCHPDRDEEFHRLAARITNNETYFFREPHHFDIVVRHVVPGLRAELRSRPLRVLSAGCSSGEEVYSLAIALQDAGLETTGLDWQIEGCDVSPTRLSQAADAAYEESSLRACDEAVRERYFRREGGRYHLKPRYRRGVRFFTANLRALGCGADWGRFDVVFCRNVLIYFDAAGFDETIALFARLLSPGGYLMLGHSESIIDRSPAFEPVYLERAVVYRRREGAT